MSFLPGLREANTGRIQLGLRFERREVFLTAVQTEEISGVIVRSP